MKIKSLLTPSPPVVRLALVFFVFLLSLTFFTPIALAQGPDNLVRLMPSAKVWDAGFDLGWMFDNPPFDPGRELPPQNQWVFKTSNPDNGFGLILHCFTNHCGLEVKSQIATNTPNQDIYEGVVYLEDLNLTYEQRVRVVNAVQRALELYKVEANPNVLASIYTGLLVWDKSYAVQASNAFMAVADHSTACSVKKLYYQRTTDLGLNMAASQLLRLISQVKDGNCATISSQNLSLFVNANLASTPVPPGQSVLPLPVSGSYQTVVTVPPVIIVKEVTTTPLPRSATPLPTATVNPAPAPTRKPGEKDFWGQIADAVGLVFRLFLLLFCLVIIAIACIVGGGYLIRHIQKVQAKEKRLKAEFAQQQRERLAEGKTRLEGLLARAKELLGSDEQVVLSETAREELNELLYVKIPPLLIFHEQGLAVGQCELNAILVRFRKQRRKK